MPLQQLGSGTLPNSCPWIPVSPVACTRTFELSAHCPIGGADHHTHRYSRLGLPRSSAAHRETPQPTGVPCPRQQLLPVSRCSGVNSSGWVLCLATRAETPLGQSWERPSRQSVSSSEILIQVPTCLCAPRLLWLIRKAFDGLMAPGMGTAGCREFFGLLTPLLCSHSPYSVLLCGCADELLAHTAP